MAKKILHILGDSKFGGGSFIVQQICIGSINAGFGVSVLTSDPRSQKHFIESGINVIDIDCIWRPIRPLKDLFGLIKLSKYLINSDYDIVHTHTTKAGFIGRIAASIARRKIILHTIHGFAFHEHSSLKVIKFYSILEKIAANFCDKIVSVSEYHRKWAIELNICNSSKIVTISNGIGVSPVPNTQENTIRKLTKADKQCKILLNVGRLAEQKGIEYLIDAVGDLVSDGNEEIICVVIGDGPKFSDFKEKVSKLNLGKHVFLLGYHDRPR